MKTLDEVIKAMNICQQDIITNRCDDCPYPNTPMCINELFNDALHYLKEYQKVDSNYWSEKAISELNNIADAYFLRAYREDKDELTALRAYWKEQNENAPLTWTELKQMEGKPVWVEYMDDEQQTGWALIVKNPERPTFGKPTLFTFVRDGGRFYLTISGYGKRWQAYRKERK